MQTDLAVFTPNQVTLLKSQIAKDCSDQELELFVTISQRTGLDPFSRQIYAIKRKGANGQMQMTIQTGIDGFRLIADRSKVYAGNDDAIFEYDELKLLIKATVTVWKFVQGQKCSFSASARWSEYCQYKTGGEITHMWDSKGHILLSKCAEALALRKGFPAELAGLYTSEEMGQADNPLPVARSVKQPVKEIVKEPVKPNPFNPDPIVVAEGLAMTTGPAVGEIETFPSELITPVQKTRMNKALKKLEFTFDEMTVWKYNLRAEYGVVSCKDLSEVDAGEVIEALESAITTSDRPK